MSMEILAPCGSRDSLIAAVRCGANAVYLGTKELNARRNADNFDFPALAGAVAYCHARGVKVYVTVNTLVSDEELPTAIRTVENALHCGADAFIVQDLGLAEILHACFPKARLHASTQCSVHTPDGFRALEERGFCRAVLPREMSLEEIKEIRRATTMELEMFVHGALCMCVSGQCYLSAMLGGRSGNRGLCAQPCRLAFSADGSGSCDLSLKDLSLMQHLGAIEAAGVLSLKIEGRMKRPEYVAAAVTACANALQGTLDPAEARTLKDVFSRSGFTDGYFTGQRRAMFGTRQKEDVLAAAPVLKELARRYEKETPRVALDITFTCRTDAPAVLTAQALGKRVRVTGAVPERAVNKPMTEASLRERLGKLGGTPYYLNNTEISLDEGLILPAAEINRLRREAIVALEKRDVPAVEPYTFTPVTPRTAKPTPYFTARFATASQIPAQHPFRRIFLPVWEQNSAFIQHRAGAELPRGVFGAEGRLKKRLAELKAIGVTEVLCGHLGAYRTAQEMGFTAYADFGMNLFNSAAARQFRSPILSMELTLAAANRINAPDTGIVAYGKLPLMLTRNCPVKERIGCERCRKQGTLTDRKGYKFPVKCSSYPCVEILNPLPVVLSDKLSEIHTDFIHFYFTDESQQEINKIVNLYKNHAKSDAQYTRGLVFRGVK